MKFTMPEEIESLITNPVPLFDGDVRREMPRSHGVYCFWWKSDEHDLPENTDAEFQGAFIGAARIQDEEIPEADLIRSNGRAYRRLCGPLKGELPAPYPFEGYTCLYVGKSDEAKGIYGRVGKHVCRDTFTRSAYLNFRPKQKAPVEQHKYLEGGEPHQILKRNTSSQFRAGLEYIFRQEPERFAYSRMKDSIYVTWIEDADMTFRDRFYLENLAIGLFHPWFNLDSER